MGLLRYSVDVDRDLHSSFEYLADLRHQSRLLPRRRYRNVTFPGAETYGASALMAFDVRVADRWVPTAVEVTLFNPPYRIVELSRNPDAPYMVTWECEAIPGGTQIDLQVSYAVPVAIIGPVVDALFVFRPVARDIEYILTRLKHTLEAPATPIPVVA